MKKRREISFEDAARLAFLGCLIISLLIVFLPGKIAKLSRICTEKSYEVCYVPEADSPFCTLYIMANPKLVDLDRLEEIVTPELLDELNLRMEQGQKENCTVFIVCPSYSHPEIGYGRVLDDPYDAKYADRVARITVGLGDRSLSECEVVRENDWDYYQTHRTWLWIQCFLFEVIL